MKSVVVVLVCVLSLVAGEEVARYHQRVGVPAAAAIQRSESMRVAGGLASFLGEHPFLAGLVVTLTNDQTSVCGGSLLSHYHVVTAAQCWWDGQSKASSILVVLGSLKLFSGGTRQYASVTVHPEYNPKNLRNDIAMLKISYVSFSYYIKPIPLPYRMNDTFVDRKAEAIGFGKTSDKSPIVNAQGLRDVYVKVISNEECSSSFGSLVTSDVMCTSGAGGRGPCTGDSGAPLIIRYFSGSSDLLIGLVSFGATNGCEAGYPSGYTRITSYIDWIHSFIK
ncbi:collagenase-like [Helicoverpa armigera]|uniref:collagenase-like n=1 Tax=Helicoverpa armigera TaxID=29058 RepID=UPI003082CBEA